MLLVKRFDLKLRDINLLLMRIRLILYSIPSNNYLDIPLLVFLLILRDQYRKLYDEYLNSPIIADRVIEYLCHGLSDLEKNNYIARIIANLLAVNENEDFDRIIKPYRDKVTDESHYDMNRRVCGIADGLHKGYQRCKRLFEVTIEDGQILSIFSGSRSICSYTASVRS